MADNLLNEIDLTTRFRSLEVEREERFKKQYEQFKREAEVDTSMRASEFESKYAILYKKDLREKYDQGLMTEKEAEFIRRLSNEFNTRVNTQRPIHIINDITGQVEYTLPPLFAKLHLLRGENLVNLDVFSNIHDREANSNDPRSQARVRQSAINLNRAIAAAQDVNDLRAQRAEFGKLAAQLNHDANHPELRVDAQVEQKVLNNSQESFDRVDNEMEFAPVEDDD